MFDEFDEEYDVNANQLVERFEGMLKKNAYYFFDAIDFETITDYYFERNNLEKAQKTIDYAVKTYPDSLLFKLKKAQLFMLKKKPIKALAIIQELERIEPDNIDIYLTKASVYSQQKKHDEAIENYTIALNLADEEDRIDIYYSLSIEYQNMNNFDQAIEMLKGAIALNEDEEDYLFDISYCFELADKNEDAIAFYQTYINEYPYSRAAWFNLGMAFSSLELYEKSIEAFAYAIAIDDGFATAYFNMANSYANIKAYDKAIEVYKDSLLHDSPNVLTYYYIGECYEKMEVYDLAISYYQEAIKADEEYADAWMGLGVSFFELNQFEAAIPAVKKALDLDPESPDYWHVYGDILTASAAFDEAILAYEKSIEFDNQNEDIWLDYSHLYRVMGDIEMAIDTLQKGHSLNPLYDSYAPRLAGYYYLAGKTKQAYQNLDFALQVAPTSYISLMEYMPELNHDKVIVALIEKYQEKPSAQK